MRYLVLSLLLCVTSAAIAERTFRASPIDLAQNERLDNHEQRLAVLEEQQSESEPEPRAGTQSGDRPVITPDPRPAPATTTVSRAVTPVPVTTRPETLREQIRRVAPNGWLRQADVRPRSAVWRHLTGEHGFSWDQVAGLTQEEALILHDLAHTGRASPSHQRSVSTRVEPIETQFTPNAQRWMTFSPVQSMGGCASGQCPISPQGFFR